MTEPEPTHEPLPSPERINTKEFTAVYGRIALSLKTGDNKIFDKNKKDIPAVSKEQFATNFDAQNFDAADNASTRERREQAKGKTVERWIEENTPILKQDFSDKEGFDEAKAQRWDGVIRAVFGVEERSQIDASKVREFYTIYCGEKTNTGAFVKKLLQIYGGDFRAIEQSRDVIQWISGAFGIQYGQLEIGLHHTLVQEQLKENNVDAFVKEVNDTPAGETLSRINRLSDTHEVPICDYLYKGGAPLETKPGKPTTPPPPDDGTKPPDGKKDETAPTTETENPAVKRIADLLKPIKEPVPDKKNNPYFVENPSYPYELGDSPLRGLSLEKEPFFVWHTGYAGENIYSNPKVIPLADELGKDKRVQAIEALTNRDSGLLALCGISTGTADTPEQQAKLYLAIVENILAFHEQNNLALLKWLALQKFPFRNLPKDAKLPNHIKSSLDIFIEHDHIIKDGKSQLRPAHEVLLRYDKDEKLDALKPEFMEDWQTRITVLRDAIKTGKLEPYHLRWIEFLSHSVNVVEMMKMMQEEKPKSPTVSKPPSSTPPTKDEIPAATFMAEVKSFNEILEAAKKIETGKPVKLVITEEGLPKLLPIFIKPIEKMIEQLSPIPTTSVKITPKNVPQKIPIQDKKASGEMSANVKAKVMIKEIFNRDFILKYVFSQLNPTTLKADISIDPPEIAGRNLQQIINDYLSKNTINQAIQIALQEQLNQGKIGVNLENIELSFTPDNTLKVVLSGKKK